MRNGLRIAALAGAILFSLPFTACGKSEELYERPSLPETDFPEAPALPETLPEEQTETPSEEQTETPEVHEPLPEESAPEPEPEQGAQKETYLQVLVSGLNVRTGAGTQFSSLGQADKGTLLKCAGKNGNWYETCYCGKQAYVSAEAKYIATVTLEPGSETTEKIIEEGLRLLGTPYVYGAVRLHDGNGRLLKNFTAAQFDCSSLMQYIFYKGANILLDVTTRTQIKQGTSVAWKDIRRGDLLFFTNASRKNKTGIERVGHVALYLGENYILHTASDFAKIEQITPLRKSYFIEARRL